MAFKVPSRTGVTTATTGTSATIELGPAIDGLVAFGVHPNSTENLANGDTCPYVIVDGGDWEYGYGTFNTSTPNTFSRDVVTASTNGNNGRLNLSGNDAQVFVDITGQDTVSRDRNGRWRRDASGLQILEFGGVKASAFTTEMFHIYPTDTSGGTFTATLPASPAQDDVMMFQDIAGSWGTNALTLDGNGNNIEGASTFSANVNRRGFRTVYDGTQWRIVVGG